MNGSRFGAVVITGLVLVAIGLSAFTVNERELAIKLQVGEVVRSDYAPGLHFKIPLIQNVRKFPKRIMTIKDDRAERIFTAERLAGSFCRWRYSSQRQIQPVAQTMHSHLKPRVTHRMTRIPPVTGGPDNERQPIRKRKINSTPWPICAGQCHWDERSGWWRKTT